MEFIYSINRDKYTDFIPMKGCLYWTKNSFLNIILQIGENILKLNL